MNDQEEFWNLVENACTRPAMYVGRESFELLAVFLQGFSDGLATKTESGWKCVLSRDFQKFLVKKYGVEEAKRQLIEDPEGASHLLREDGSVWPLYGNVVWYYIYMLHFKGTPDKELCRIFLQDLRDYKQVWINGSSQSK